MSRKPSKRVLNLFEDVEIIADQLIELKAEEDRLREMLRQLWRTRTCAMAELAMKAREASEAEIRECTAAQKGRRK
jgi:hypothetical protein